MKVQKGIDFVKATMRGIESSYLAQQLVPESVALACQATPLSDCDSRIRVLHRFQDPLLLCEQARGCDKAPIRPKVAPAIDQCLLKSI